MEVTSDTDDCAFHRKVYCSQFPDHTLEEARTLRKQQGTRMESGRHAKPRAFIVGSAGRAMGGSGGKFDQASLWLIFLGDAGL